MANQDQHAKTGAGEPARQKFSEMTAFGKLMHIGKVVVFIFSFGFAFPTLFSD
ncbi:MAG TPA: hypothetical protein VFC14_15895 [Burkholderiales bacterium]|nr:hypothetical protein [Burkholderiales bacterium]